MTALPEFPDSTMSAIGNQQFPSGSRMVLGGGASAGMQHMGSLQRHSGMPGVPMGGGMPSAAGMQPPMGSMGGGRSQFTSAQLNSPDPRFGAAEAASAVASAVAPAKKKSAFGDLNPLGR